MKIGEFFIQLGVSAESKKLKEFVGDLGQLQLGALANIASVAALAAELVKLGAEATNAAVGFQLFQNTTGLSWKELQKWQIVAQQANVSADTVASSITNLQRQIAEVRLGRGNIAPFQLLGVAPTDAFDVLNKLRDRIRGLDAATATNIISQMGLSPEMINVLRLTDSEFAKLSKTVRGMTTDQEQQFLRTKQAMVQLGMAFKYLGFDIVGHFLAAFEKLIPLLNHAYFGFFRLRDILIALAIYFFPVQAAIIGLLLVLDDLAVYFTGGKSITGKAIEGLKQFGQELKNAFTGFNVPKISQLLGLGNMGPMGNLMTGALAGAKTLTNNFHINVTGAGSAVDIANEVTRQIARHFSKSEQEFNNQGH